MCSEFAAYGYGPLALLLFLLNNLVILFLYLVILELRPEGAVCFMCVYVCPVCRPGASGAQKKVLEIHLASSVSTSNVLNH